MAEEYKLAAALVAVMPAVYYTCPLCYYDTGAVNLPQIS
jgi:hypothetical protein